MQSYALRVAAAGVCLLWSANASHAAEKIAWSKTFAAAQAQAKTTHKLIMTDFFTEW